MRFEVGPNEFFLLFGGLKDTSISTTKIEVFYPSTGIIELFPNEMKDGRYDFGIVVTSNGRVFFLLWITATLANPARTELCVRQRKRKIRKKPVTLIILSTYLEDSKDRTHG